MADLAEQFGADTLDEPVSETIMRDVRLVARRLALVVMPGISSSVVRAELRDWDLWGPLFICMSLAVMLSIEAHDEASLVFSVIFVIMWVGAAVVTVNGQLLGGRLSFFQSVCLLGYCVFPILLSAAACLAFNSFIPARLAVILRFVAVVIALLWAIMGAHLLSLASSGFACSDYAGIFLFYSEGWYFLTTMLSDCLSTQSYFFETASSSFMTDAKFPQGRKVLALYPVMLFYLSLAWMVLIGFQQGPLATAVPGDGTGSAFNGTRVHEF